MPCDAGRKYDAKGRTMIMTSAVCPAWTCPTLFELDLCRKRVCGNHRKGRKRQSGRNSGGNIDHGVLTKQTCRVQQPRTENYLLTLIAAALCCCECSDAI